MSNKSLEEMDFDEQVNYFTGQIVTRIAVRPVRDVVAEVLSGFVDVYFVRGVNHEKKKKREDVKDDEVKELAEEADVAPDESSNVEARLQNLETNQQAIYVHINNIIQSQIEYQNKLHQAMINMFANATIKD